LWLLGYGKIAVVLAVNLEYSDEAAHMTKALKGYVASLVDQGKEDSDPSLRIDWQANALPLVKCWISYANQTWVPWDESFA
jgi:alpha-1,3-mannosyltransferase